MNQARAKVIGVDPLGRLLLLQSLQQDVGCKDALTKHKSATDRCGGERGAENRKVKDYESCLDSSSLSLMSLAFELY